MENKQMWPGWEIIELIGSGGFSKVYKIKKVDDSGDFFSALKVISIPQTQDEYRVYKADGYDEESITQIFKSQVDDLVKEFKLMARFRGTANIVSYEDHMIVPKEDGLGWNVLIRMELLTTLPEYYLKTPLDERQTITLGVDICRALSLCEKLKIVHRDIKPQNIFVNEFGDYKLGDFGVARAMEHTTHATKIGTYAYMAPEVYNNQPYSASTDLYSLGLVLYWLLNERRLPFVPMPPTIPTSAQNSEAQNRRFNGEALPAPKHGSEELKQAVLKACAYDPKDRYKSAEEMGAALSAVLSNTKKSATVVVPDEVVDDDDKTVFIPIQKDDEDDKTVLVKSEDNEKTVSIFEQQDDDDKTTLLPQSNTTPSPALEPEEKEYQNTDNGNFKDKDDSTHKNNEKQTKKSKKGLLILLCLLLLFGMSAGVYWLACNVFGWQYFWQANDDIIGYESEEQTIVENGFCPIHGISFELWDAPYGFVIRGNGSVFPPDTDAFHVDCTCTRIFGKIKHVCFISIEEGVTAINDNAFHGLAALESVTIPSSITYIGENIFADCPSLKEIRYNGTKVQLAEVTDEDALFEGCLSTIRLIFKDGEVYTYDEESQDVTSETSNATPKIATVSIESPPTKTSYYVGDVFDYSGLTLEITYTDGRTETVSDGFVCDTIAFNTKGEQDITVSYGDKEVVVKVTVMDVAVESITISSLPNKVVYYEGETLDTTGLSVTAHYGDGTTRILPIDSYECEAKRLDSIGSNSITVIYKDLNTFFAVEVIGVIYSGNFNDNINWKIAADGHLIISGRGRIEWSEPFSSAAWLEHSQKIKQITIEEGVSYLDSFAIMGCSQLKRIELPASLTEICQSAFGIPLFAFCDLVEFVNVNLNNPAYSSIDGVLFNKNKTEMIYFPSGRKGEYAVPAGVMQIYQAFSHCSLTKIYIPCTVSLFDGGCFVGASSLQHIEVDSNNANVCSVDGVVYSKDKCLILYYPVAKTDNSFVVPEGVVTITQFSFRGLKYLSSLTIPVSVTKIEGYCFESSEMLKRITYKGTKAQWDSMLKGEYWTSGAVITTVKCTDVVISV